MARSTSGGSAAAPAIFAALLLSGLATQPSTEQLRQRAAVRTVYQNQDATVFSAKDKKLIEEHCGPGGLPVRIATPAEPLRVLVRKTYVLGHSSQLRFPLWVCEHLTETDLKGPDTGRLKPEPFSPDPMLNGFPRAELKDYAGSGFARGHMMPDADRTSNSFKEETYFLSNMVPQVGGQFNSSKWRQLEEKVRTWAGLRKNLRVITGGLIHEPAEENPRTADGLVNYYVIGTNQVAVPTHVYKIIVSEETPGTLDALAVIMENRPYLSKANGAPPDEQDFTAFLHSIDEVEELTGFDFFSELDAAKEKKMESHTAPALWPEV